MKPPRAEAEQPVWRGICEEQPKNSTSLQKMSWQGTGEENPHIFRCLIFSSYSNCHYISQWWESNWLCSSWQWQQRFFRFFFHMLKKQLCWEIIHLNKPMSPQNEHIFYHHAFVIQCLLKENFNTEKFCNRLFILKKCLATTSLCLLDFSYS